jgi:hypothetical protein
MFESPAAAFAGTVTVNGCGELALTLRGNAELVVAPAGRPEIVTDTVPVKPFAATTETVMGELVAPWTTLREVGETERRKSAAGGGGGGLKLPPPLPQPATRIAPHEAASMIRRMS